MAAPVYERITQAIEPVGPDFYYCHPFYGQALSVPDCTAAAGYLPTGSEPVELATSEADPSHTVPLDLPFISIVRGCKVSVQAAYVDSMINIENQGFEITPDKLRSTAGWVIEQCVGQARQGGFATLGILNMAQYLIDPTTTLAEIGNGPWPARTAWLTVTVSQPGFPSGQNPGLFDPVVVQDLADLTRYGGRMDVSDRLQSQAHFMSRENPAGWWHAFEDEGSGSESEVESDSMVYNCDAGLGSPKAVDCNQISFSELGAPSDSITIGSGPGATKTLSSNSCRVAITSAVTVTLTWAQIRAALETLIDSCVTDPYTSAQGGVASAGPVTQVQVGTGSGAGRKRDIPTTGLNALPPGVKITVSSN